MIKRIINHKISAHRSSKPLEDADLSSCQPYKKRALKVLSIMIIISATVVMSSCKKWAETPVPTDKIADNAVYTNDATAIAMLTGIYGSMNAEPVQGSTSNGSISLFEGLSADEFKLANGIAVQKYLDHYQNALSQSDPSKNSGAEHWALFFKFIFKANAAIIGLSSSQADALNPTVRQQLLGEAKFVRAFFYFYLVNEFGDVPLVLTTDPQAITVLPRTAKDEVYQQIISDLLDAEEKLSSDYLDVTLLKTTTERVRPTKWGADALLARIYLYTGDWAKAEERATAVITNTQFSLLPLNNVFLKNSKEAIWQIQPTDANFNTQEGRTLIIPVTGPSTGGSTQNPVYLSKFLLNSFEAGDKRAIYGNWIDTTIYQISPGKSDTVAYPFKYKINSSPSVTSPTGMAEYFMVLRLAEQYLIRAEARVHLNNIGGTQADLNAIRNRAGLGNTTASDQSSLLSAILHERQVELFSEWGHRWFDLRRTGNIDAVMSVVTPQKANGAAWQSYQQWYPIPMEALNTSPNLRQNTGY